MPRQYALKVQRKVNKGWLKEASKLGQLWDIVRNGSVVTSNKPYIVTRWYKSKDIELETVSYIYRVRGDRRNLAIGDQIVGKDIASSLEQSALLERYTIVGMRLLHDNIAIRTDRACKIYRPTQDITDGVYSEQTVLNSPGLVFDSGTNTWSFVETDTPSDVWMGITFGRLRDYDQPVQLPLTTDPTGWTLSCGLLPGVLLKEADMVVDADQNWYRVTRPQYQFNSASLYQLHATRVTA